MHGGATASLVDLVGSAAIFTVAPASGVSIEINVSYLDSAFLDVGNFSLPFFFFPNNRFGSHFFIWAIRFLAIHGRFSWILSAFHEFTMFIVWFLLGFTLEECQLNWDLSIIYSRV